jgi:hypothetical protein
LIGNGRIAVTKGDLRPLPKAVFHVVCFKANLQVGRMLRGS